ncbi:hypothetical protein [Bacillus sp. NPDC093026]|uniref:hypothetical protein n=1 Tax=Bacillus sp. NPDC093026 TaxID=3363948 RepID=UPI00382DBC8B
MSSVDKSKINFFLFGHLNHWTKKQYEKQQKKNVPKQKDMPSYAEAETKKMQYGQK